MHLNDRTRPHLAHPVHLIAPAAPSRTRSAPGRTRSAASVGEGGRSIIPVYDFSPHVSRRGCGRRCIGVGAEIGEWLLGQRGAGGLARSRFFACPVSLTHTICCPRHSCQQGGPGGRAGISKWDLDTPALCVDLDKIEANIAKMQAALTRNGVAARPHAKTHKCAAIAKLQMAAGAIGICTAKLSEAEALFAAGRRARSA